MNGSLMSRLIVSGSPAPAILLDGDPERVTIVLRAELLCCWTF